jgi:peptide methionine sulfoxide reductase MsrB
MDTCMRERDEREWIGRVSAFEDGGQDRKGKRYCLIWGSKNDFAMIRFQFLE